jgi:peptide-methionine (S)-S-oxide reductase
MNSKNKKATFAAGCFWGVEKAFGEIPGVIETQVGYTGGLKENPSYKDVCGGNTGHAEAVEVEYNSDILSYEKLLDVFWTIHDPTQKNRQGPDVGSQYRSVIFYHDEEQKQLAEKSKADLTNAGKPLRHYYNNSFDLTSYSCNELKYIKDKEIWRGGKYKNPITTQIEPAQHFWRAEEYHQKYLFKNKQAACHI